MFVCERGMNEYFLEEIILISELELMLAIHLPTCKLSGLAQ